MKDDRHKDDKRWIDLSLLPINEKTGHIDWINSVGLVLQFVYGDVSGTIKIFDYIKGKPIKVKILIQTSYMSKKYCIRPAYLKECRLKFALLRPIRDTHPHLINFFLNYKDTLIYSANSGVKTQLVCPICGAIKTQRIEDFIYHGFSCPICGDGVSYPEKLLFNVLKQLNVDFLQQITKDTPGFHWIDGKYRYDFYIEHNHQRCFIELDGRFHNRDLFDMCKNVRKNDLHKNELAHENNIEMIRINCDYPNFKKRFDFIKENIENSKLSNIIDFKLVDWDYANKMSTRSNVVVAAQLWEDDRLYLSDIANELGVSQNTVREYLKIGTRFGLCNYNREETYARKVERFGNIALKGANKQVAVFNNNILVGVFFNATELENMSDELYGVHFKRSVISSTCIGRVHSYFGYSMKYISYQEYEKFIKHFQNNIQLNIKNGGGKL